MTTTGKVLVTGLVGGGIYLFASSSSAKSPEKRKAFKKSIPTVPNDIPWKDVDEAICQCYAAGEHESVALVNCTLKRLWPDVPWPHQPGDHLTVLRVWQAVGARVATFMALPEDGKIKACEEIEEPPPPPPPGGEIDFDDFVTNKPGGFAVITQTGNNNPTRTVTLVYGYPANAANNGRVLLCMAACGFNLLFYSRPRNAGSYGAASIVTASGDRRNYDIGPAWMPWNDRVAVAAETGQKLLRRTGWNASGPVEGSARAFGTPWMPPVTATMGGIVVCRNADPWAPEINPPAEALAKLGWTLPEMKAAWLAGNP